MAQSKNSTLDKHGNQTIDKIRENYEKAKNGLDKGLKQ